MLDAEARALLDLMDKAVQDGRPKLETLPHAVGRKAVDKMSEDSEAEPLGGGRGRRWRLRRAGRRDPLPPLPAVQAPRTGHCRPWSTITAAAS